MKFSQAAIVLIATFLSASVNAADTRDTHWSSPELNVNQKKVPDDTLSAKLECFMVSKPKKNCNAYDCRQGGGKCIDEDGECVMYNPDGVIECDVNCTCEGEE